eukprot:4649104-Lingulodinium_polyedra.AAC.1
MGVRAEAIWRVGRWREVVEWPEDLGPRPPAQAHCGADARGAQDVQGGVGHAFRRFGVQGGVGVGRCGPG